MNNDTYIGYTVKGRARTLGIEDDCVFHSVIIIILNSVVCENSAIILSLTDDGELKPKQ
jgi:hypothetical protein